MKQYTINHEITKVEEKGEEETDDKQREGVRKRDRQQNKQEACLR